MKFPGSGASRGEAGKQRNVVLARLAEDHSLPVWDPAARAGDPATVRHGSAVGRLAATAARQLLFPKGSSRDKFYAHRVRPFLMLAMGKSQRVSLPLAKVSAIESPATQLLDAGDEIRSVLVIKVDHIGDMLLGLPALAKLRRRFPDATITLLCGPWNVGLVKRMGIVDHVLPLEFFSRQADSSRRPVFNPALIERLGLPFFDLAIDLRVDEDTRVLLHHVSARFKAGYFSRRMPTDMTVVLPQVTLNPAEHVDIMHHQTALMTRLVDTVISYLDPVTDLTRLLSLATDEYSSEMGALLADLPRPVIGVNAASGREIKNWPLENFVNVCRWITGELGGTVVLIGGPGDAKMARVIVRNLGNNRVRDYTGKLSLEKSFAMLRHVDLYVGNDSGLTHAAAAGGTPTLAVYSGIDPIAMWIPLGPRATALKASVPCSPCHLTHLTDCPNGHACVRAISVNTVKLTIQRMLTGARGAPRLLAAPLPQDGLA